MGMRKGNELRGICRVVTNLEEDSFVGVRFEDGNISVTFPLGYNLPDEDKEIRNDILRLISVLSRYVYNQEQQLPINQTHNLEIVNFPMQAYMGIMNDYMQNGYYTENEVFYHTGNRGKINWSKTIKNKKPFPQDNSLIYLDYIVKESSTNSISLISLIHEYCVYESFRKLGWLYTSAMPRKPKIQKLQEQVFSNAIYDKLSQTFNDKHKSLFENMLSMINYLGQKDAPQQFYFGTERFEYVWEKLIDFTFGITEKNEFFPRTKWILSEGKNRINAALEPDTIMIIEDKIYILDAKYYKFGITANPKHLPESTSINKQITYGEYINEQSKFKKRFGDNLKVYNAFLMPFDMKDAEKFKSKSNVKCIGEGIGEWKKNNEEHERVQGILIDTRCLIYNVIRQNVSEIVRLGEEIEKVFVDK